MKKLIAALFVLALVAGGAWLGFRDDRDVIIAHALASVGLKGGEQTVGERPKAAAARQVRVVRPEPASGSFTLTLSGRTAPAEQAFISSRASGVVSERRVDIGDTVKAGEVLLVIEAPEVAQELLRARATVDQIKARLELAKLTLDRASTLEGKGHVSEQTVDERRAAKITAEADLAAADAEVKRLEEVVSFQTVKAPFAGTVVARQVERGDKVSADQNQPGSYLYRIARLDELRIEIDVPQSSALSVKTGSQAHIEFAELPGEKLAARVVRSSGLIDPASSTMRAELLMANPDNRIPAGLNGQVAIEVDHGPNAVTVPTNTLFTREGRQVVATVGGDDKVAFLPVAVTRDLGERVVISAGLKADTRVIVSPNALLRPGDPVEVIVPTARAASANR
jgi:multidrug efflux system membrane fusion protein